MNPTETTTATPIETTTTTPDPTATTAMERLQKSMARTSLDDLVKARTRRTLLLVDVSSSMAERVAAGKKITLLREVVRDLLKTHAVPVAAFGGREVYLVEEIPDPNGGTPLAEAIDFATHEGANHLVVVTDGQPNHEGGAFAAARTFGGTIDTFYIGDGNDRGSQFCQELSAMTGGVAHLTDLGKPKELSAKIAGLLGDGTDVL
jgi:Mg-chelatase subunit ChlD